MNSHTRSVRLVYLAAALAVIVAAWLFDEPPVTRAQNGTIPLQTYLPVILAEQTPTDPTITTSPVITATAGVTYTYALAATGFPTPTFSIERGPQGMTVDAEGIVAWLPDDEGRFDVTIRASNGSGNDAFQSYAIEVTFDFYWDPRLDQRGARLVEADVATGELYWRLVEARWLNDQESQGRHHIYMDTLSGGGVRMAGVPIAISWADGGTAVVTEEKPGESYAADFAMYALAPAYDAQPQGVYPADRVEGMGLGELEVPDRAHHTSYELTWKLSIKADKAAQREEGIPWLRPVHRR